MITVGLTGGIASGKSLIGKTFQKLGAYLIDADTIARQAVIPQSQGWEQVVKSFGCDILNKKGEIDRKRLGKIIFSDPAKRQKLNEILHPVILSLIREQIRSIAISDPEAVVVADIPLLIECGMEEEFDRVIVAWTDRESQIKRIMARDGLLRADAERRIDAQMPLNKKKIYADYVIENVGAKKDVEKIVKKIYFSLKKQKIKKSKKRENNLTNKGNMDIFSK